VFTNDFREEGLPGIGTQVLVDDVTDKLEKGTFALASPLSPAHIDGYADMGGKKGPPLASEGINDPSRTGQSIFGYADTDAKKGPPPRAGSAAARPMCARRAVLTRSAAEKAVSEGNVLGNCSF
jgi:hypothetical protein